MSRPRRTLRLALPAATLAALLTGASLASAQAQTPTAPPTSGPSTSAQPSTTTKPTSTVKPTTGSTTTKPAPTSTSKPKPGKAVLSVTRLPKSRFDTMDVRIDKAQSGQKFNIYSELQVAGADRHTASRSMTATTDGETAGVLPPPPGGWVNGVWAVGDITNPNAVPSIKVRITVHTATSDPGAGTSARLPKLPSTGN